MLREFHAITATHQTLTKFLCCETAEPGQADHVARYTRYGNFFFLPPSSPGVFFCSFLKFSANSSLSTISPVLSFFSSPSHLPLYSPRFTLLTKTTHIPSCLTAVVVILAAAILTGKSLILRDQPPLSRFRLQHGVCLPLLGRTWL
jgi:hypothetical protein